MFSRPHGNKIGIDSTNPSKARKKLKLAHFVFYQIIVDMQSESQNNIFCSKVE
jgi:hypothetical protein